MKKLIALIALSFGIAHAGNMKTDTDSFTGEVDTYFIGSDDGGAYVISRLSSGQAVLTVRPRQGLTHCNRFPLLMKTSDSKIHKLKADETGSRACHAIINHKLLKGGVVVRVPMYNDTDVDIIIDTTNLDWASMGTRKETK